MKTTTRKLLTGALIAAALACPPVLAGEVLDRVMKNGVIKVANDANWSPQSFLNDNNEMDGFDVDVAKDIARRMGVKVEFVNPDWDVITAGNWSGRWDVSIGSMTPTEERAKALDFPAVYYYTPAAAAVHKDSSAKKPSDLTGKVVGVASNTTYEYYVLRELEIFNGPPFEYLVTPSETYSLENTSVLLDDLRLGDGVRIDGVIGNMPTMLEAVKKGYPIRVLQPPVFYEPLAIATEKGDQDFNDKLAAIIGAMREDGTLVRLSQKWYGADYAAVQ